MKTCTRKTKKYSNIKDCEEQPREICDKGDGCYNISRKIKAKKQIH